MQFIVFCYSCNPILQSVNRLQRLVRTCVQGEHANRSHVEWRLNAALAIAIIPSKLHMSSTNPSDARSTADYLETNMIVRLLQALVRFAIFFLYKMQARAQGGVDG